MIISNDYLEKRRVSIDQFCVVDKSLVEQGLVSIGGFKLGRERGRGLCLVVYIAFLITSFFAFFSFSCIFHLFCTFHLFFYSFHLFL